MRDVLSAKRRRYLLATLIVVNAAVFLFAPETPLGPGTPGLPTRDKLRSHDRSYRSRFDAVR